MGARHQQRAEGRYAIPVTLVISNLQAEWRLSGSSDEAEIARRLLLYVTAAIEKHLGATAYAACPDPVLDEAAIRLGAYLYDQPTAGVGSRYSNALRNSGAAKVLLPWRLHRAGVYSAT